MTPEEYCKYNLFVNLKSPYAKPVIIGCRILIAALFLVVALTRFRESMPAAIGIAAVGAVIELLLTPVIKLGVKGMVKSVNKNNLYSSVAEVELTEESVRETDELGVLERKYAAIDCACIVKDFGIILFLTPSLAIVLPDSSFKTQEEYNEIVSFIRSKVEKTKDFA